MTEKLQSPFPGMDPYIESCGLWEDFHTHLIEKIYESLSESVPERYTVRTGERSYIVLAEAEGKETHSFKPDVGVTASGDFQPSATEEVAVLPDASDSAPIALRAFIQEEFRETFIEIHEAAREQHLVTAIEVLSPTNKRKAMPGWDLYLRKRQALLMGTANLIEIDLLRGGQRMPMLDPWPQCPYTLLVARKHRAPSCLVWPGYFHRPLPPIPVPLLKPDPDVPLSLQPMVQAIYARSRYHRSIDYSRPLTPSPSTEEAVWIEQVVSGSQG